MKRNLLRKLLIGVWAVMLFLTPDQVRASHAMGADLTYECLGGNTYRMRLSFYRDCIGISAPSNVYITINSASCGQSLGVTCYPVPGTGVEVTPICPSAQSTCNGGNFTGIQEWVYEGIVTLPMQCTDWLFGYDLCCRNAAITTITNPGTSTFHVFASLNNTIPGCNTSPVFSNKPVPFVCLGQQFCFNHGAFDAEGDSLVYSLITPMQTSATTVNYIAPYTATEPLNSSPALQFNPQTGDFCITPQQLQITVMAVLVQEYRNGVLIGSVERDIQITVINCSNNLPTLTGINGTNNFSMTACANEPFCFDIFASDPDSGQNVFVSWDGGIPGATFSSNGAQPPTGTFCWTPPDSLIGGTYCFTATVHDDACPYIGTQVYSYCIEVIGIQADAGPDVAVACNDVATLYASATGGSGVYTYQWSTGATTVGITVGAGTYILTASDGQCTDTDTVQVTNTFVPTAAFSAIYGCVNVPVQFTDESVTPGGVIISWTWLFGDSTQSNVQNPVHLYTSPGTYTVQLIIENNLGCIDTVSQQIVITPVPVASFTAPSGCAGTGIVLNNTSVPPGGIYSWNFGNGQTSNGTNPTVIYGDSGTYTITLIASDSSGCADTVSLPVTVYPTPVAGFTFSGSGICQDATIAFTDTSTGATGYSWNFGNGQTSTQHNPSTTYTQPGNYNVTLVVTSANGCVDSITQTVVVYPPPTANAGANVAVCQGSNITLNATGGGTYVWNTGATTGTISVSPSGTTVYTVTVTDAYGCTAMDTVTVTVNPLPVPNVSPDQTICVGQSVTLSASGGQTYSWNPTGSSTPTITVSPTTSTTYAVNVSDANGCTGTAFVNVTVNPLPVIGLSNAFLCTSQTTTLNAGNPGSTYVWSTGQTSQAITVSTAGTYTVLVTNAFGCTAMDSSQVSQGGSITNSLTNAEFCQGGSAVLNAGNPGNTYLWSTGATSQTITVTTAGSYSVTITDLNGCSGTVATTVNVFPLPVAQFTPNDACINDPITFIDVSTINGGSIVSWYWDFGDGNLSQQQNPTHQFINNGIQTITLIVTSDNGCTDTITKTVNIYPNPQANFTHTKWCESETAAFTDLSFTNFGNIVSWTWDFGDGAGSTQQNPTHHYMSPGTYTVTLTVVTNGGCEDVQSHFVTIYPLPVMSIAMGNACVGTPILPVNNTTTTNGAVNNWQWNFGNGNVSSQFTPVAQVYNTPGTFPVSLIATTSHGCTDSMTVPVTIYPLPPANAGPDQSICLGGSATLTASGGGTYAWSPGGSTNATITVNPQATTTYGVLVTNGNGCQASDSVRVIVKSLPMANAGADQTICAGGNVTLTATGGVVYAWQPGGATTSSITVSPASGTIYSVTVTGSNGCSATDSVGVTVNPLPAAAAGPDKSICLGTTTSFTATGGTSYVWSTGASTASIYVSPTVNTTYVVTVTDANGCSARDTVAATVLPVPVVSLNSEQICAGESVVFNAGNPGASYLWSPGGQTTQSITVTQAGTYSVVVTGANGCQAGATAAVSVGGTGITGNLGNAAFCAGQSTMLNAGNPGSQFQWSTGSTTQTISVNAGGIYTVTITDSTGCAGTYQCLVTVNPIPTAAFTPPGACVNTLLQFTDGSSIGQGNIIQWAWTFGDGSLSAAQNPAHTYASAGTFTASLVVTSGNGCTDSIAHQVFINSDPLADFGSTTACQGDQTLFTDLSTVTGGVITGWSWSFGDGGTSSAQHPAHTYAGDGTYNVTLIVNTAFGCVDTLLRTVTVNPTPEAAFAATEECQGIPTVFTDLSTIKNGSIDGWFWDFGDGATSSLQNPTHTYAASGNYTVTLVVNSDLGCLDTVTQNVPVRMLPAPSFTAGPVCEGGTTVFSNTSSIGTGSLANWYWSFGDGYSSAQQNPVHTYSTYGTYTVLLAVTSGLGCIDTLVQTVTVHPRPNAAFAPVSNCIGALTQFMDSSSVPGGGTVAAWSWNFGGGNTSTAANPVFTFSAPGTYPVSLVVTSGDGCIDTVTKSVNIFPEPTVAFSAGDVCFGLATAFTNQSTVSGGGGASVTAVWSFGDGTTDTTLNPVHVFGAPGTYTVTMTATTVQGCSSSAIMPVSVFENPEAFFRGTDVCIDGPTMFMDSSYVPNNGGTIVQWGWNFGDGGTSASKNPIHLYANPGTYLVALTVMSDRGCTDDYQDSLRVFPAPQPVISASAGCITDPVVFVNANDPTNQQGNLILWSFGDGTSSSTASPSHTYAAPGIYTVTLEVINANNCRTTATTDVEVFPQPVAGFTADDGCAGEEIQFVNTSIITSGTIVGFAWNFGDGGTSVLENPVHTFATPGVYTVQLIVTSSLGCTDTVTGQVIIHELPVSQFSAINTEGCGPLPVQFTDNSFIGNGTIVGWSWNFGDGGTDTVQNPVHVYTATGNYTVTLTVTSDKGCQATVSISNMVTVFPQPLAEFIPDPETTTTLNPVFTFNNVSEGAVSYHWWFGDGNESNALNPTHTYTDSGTFVVTLAVVNSWGCEDTVQHIVKVVPVTTFFIPNCFTPNADGINDVFTIKGYNIVNVQFDIWNRWGEKVFTTTDGFRKPWDGIIEFSSGNVAKEDVYIYTATILDVYGKIHNRTGRVSLIR